MTSSPVDGTSTFFRIARRVGALLYLRIGSLLYLSFLVLVIPAFVGLVIWALAAELDLHAIWVGAQSTWLFVYNWASQQPIFVQVAIGIGLVIGFPLICILVIWAITAAVGGAFVGLVAYVEKIGSEARILFGGSTDVE